MSVEDIANQSSVVFGIQHDKRDPIFGVHVFPGSAKTLVRRSEITLSVTSLPKINKICWCALKLKCATSVSFFLRHSVHIANFAKSSPRSHHKDNDYSTCNGKWLKN